ncbi:MAG: 4a-hydroxytetrahydrobiopterin dehydratase [bacterium]|nr:4a-hydroxytetrahydrobiopterin dehydratase [bacterium]
MELKEKKCVPCEGGVPKLSAQQADDLLKEIPDWQRQGDKLFKNFKFKNFIKAMEFVNRMAEVAEEEGHHPDFTVHYNQVEVLLWTHAIDGLSENDFILAAKIDDMTPSP